MSNAAPVCQIQPVISKAQPGPTNLPAIPVATDLTTALQAINAIGMWLRQAQGRLNPAPVTQNSPMGLKTTKGNTPQQGRWTTVSQQYKTVRVYNPTDKSQYVDVQQIEALTMGDTQTGEKWIWSR